MPTPVKPFRVVLDPGHGGADEGTVFPGPPIRITEKQITLQLALEAAEELRMRGIDVVLTRTTDLDVPLSVRTAVANRLGAQVFLSIHLNSTPDPARHDAEGIETYILNHTTDASSYRLAQLENTVLTRNPTQEALPSEVALILKDLRLDANLAGSKALACALQQNLVAHTGAFSPRKKKERNRGVKQALFHVLLGADMPSALLEAGFLTSEADRSLLLSSKWRRKMARSIAESLSLFESNPSLSVGNCQVH